MKSISPILKELINGKWPGLLYRIPACDASSALLSPGLDTFDFGVIAAAAAVLSLVGFAASKKH